jgi:hypothetical protein
MFKMRSVLIAVTLVALLSFPAWKVSASESVSNQPSNNQLIMLGEIQSTAPVQIYCDGSKWMPSPDGTKCICKPGYKPTWDGTGCKMIDPGEPPAKPEKPNCTNFNPNFPMSTTNPCNSN